MAIVTAAERASELTGDASVYAAAVDRLLGEIGDKRGTLLPLLHALQAEFGHIDDALVPHVAEALNLSRADVHGVVTFYHDFRRRRPGRHVVRLCRAESCQARGAVAIERAAVDRLGVAMGTTSGDGQVSLEPVYCLGLCAIGPNALVDGLPVSRIDDAALDRIIAQVNR
jgi:formate dehydrogenase subunit gamma